MSMIPIGSDCWDCSHCIFHYRDCCLAGHGDNDFSKVTKEQFDKLMDKTETEEYRKEALKKYFPEYLE